MQVYWSRPPVGWGEEEEADPPPFRIGDLVRLGEFRAVIMRIDSPTTCTVVWTTRWFWPFAWLWARCKRYTVAR